MQLGLFRGGAPTFDRTFSMLARIDLGDGAWVDHQPSWLQGHEALYEALVGSCAWQSDRRMMYERVVDVPRLTAKGPRGNALIDDVREELSGHYRLALPSVSLNWYRDGKDSVAFHGDKMGPLIDDTVIAIVSVGAPRRFLMRPAPGGVSRAYNLGSGDLLVMGGACQRTWVHGVPKVARAGPRISIMFRETVPAVYSAFPWETRNGSSLASRQGRFSSPQAAFTRSGERAKRPAT